MSASPFDRLRFILGRWSTSGFVLDGDTATATIVGTDEYELMDGGNWIIHRVDVVIGDERSAAIELIGEPDPDGRFRMRAFDRRGAYDEMTLEQRSDGAWGLEGDGVRSTLRAGGDDEMSAVWERFVDGSWVDWMRMRFDKG